MPTIEITITDALYGRLKNAAPKLDLDHICEGAIQEALNRRRALQEPTTMGRPVKRAGRKQVTVQLEPDYLAQVDDLAAALKVSRPDALNLILEAAITDGIPQRLAKKMT